MTSVDLEFWLYFAAVIAAGLILVALGAVGTGEGNGVRVGIAGTGVVVMGYAVYLAIAFAQGEAVKVRTIVYIAPFLLGGWLIKAVKDRKAATKR